MNAMTIGGITPMMLAVKLNREKAVEHLLNKSANPFLKDQFGQEAIDYKVAFARSMTGRSNFIIQLMQCQCEQSDYYF